MNRLHIPRLKKVTSIGFLTSMLLFGACATPDRPRVLQEANDRIQSSETGEIEDLQPRLIREAKQFEIQARKAYERRDLDEAKLYAHLAIQRYDTARNLVKRDASEQLAGLMAEADQDLSKEEAKLAEEQRELARYQQLQNRFDSVTGELAQVREDQQGAAAQARRLLLKARSAQAEALGAGASAMNSQSYAEARLEVENALEAYDAQLFDESSSASQRAISAFEQLAENAQESARARRKAEQEMLARAAEKKEESSEAQSKARAAIEEATEARTTAIGARMPQERKPLYEQGVFLLESAERRLRDENYSGAVQKANDARDIFLSAALDKNVASEQDALGDGTASTGQVVANGADSKSTRAIERAEDARGSALARGATLLDMERADYALELARKARDRGESTRAVEKAGQAAALYEELGMSSDKVAAPTTPLEGSTVYSSSGSTSGLRALAEEQIVRLQLERAEALGDMTDEACPGDFREFEAVLELAQQRFDARDYAQAFEFSVRASERLKKCGATGTSTTSTGSAKAPTRAAVATSSKPSAEERAEAKARDEAATALATAQGDYAVLDATLDSKTKDLREPQILIVNAERWFKQKDYPQAEALAKRAIESMEAIRIANAAPKEEPKIAKKPSASTTVSTKTTPPKSPEQLAEDARLQEVCRRVDDMLEQVKGAQLRASSATLEDNAQQRYKRAIRTFNRAKSLRAEQRCESSELLAEESLDTFEELADTKDSSTGSTVAVATPRTNPDPKPSTSTKTEETSSKPSSEELARQKQLAADASSAIAAAKLARAQVISQSDNNVFATADSLLKEAERASASSSYAKAQGLANQAAGAFKSLDANASPMVTASGETVDPSWKPAYSKVLDALILRDEIKAQIGEPEQDTFERGVKNIERARIAWDSRDFMAAGRFADAAKDDFNKALQQKEARELAEEQARAEKIARENEAERQARLKREKQEAEAAAQKERDAQAAAASEKAAAAQAAEQEIVQNRRAADDVLREAAIKRELCDKEKCSLRDEVGLVRANETLESAKAAMGRDDFVRAKELGSAALMSYETILAKPRSFAITSNVTRVTLAGDRLILNPKVKFESGTTVIVAESLESLNELSTVLRENESTLKGVELVGYTDSRGNDTKNQKLSEQRAAAVMKALIDRGVPRELLTSKGLGETNPVATNKTANGRELNRRVEVIINKKGE